MNSGGSTGAAPDAQRALRSLVDRIVTDGGYDLDDLTVTPAGRRRVVRVIIDRDEGVSLDDAATVSRTISAELDAAGADDPLGPQAYTLEVTSRGVGRPLTLPRHYRRARTRLVALTTSDGRDIAGHVLGASETDVQLLAGPDGAEEIVVPYSDIARAAVQVEFRSPSAALRDRLGIDPRDSHDLGDDQLDGNDGRADGEEAE
jgi:ribosome maturation factor RimP